MVSLLLLFVVDTYRQCSRLVDLGSCSVSDRPPSRTRLVFIGLARRRRYVSVFLFSPAHIKEPQLEDLPLLERPPGSSVSFQTVVS